MNNAIHEFYEKHKDAEIMQPINRFTNKPEVHLASPFNTFKAEYPAWASGDQSPHDAELALHRLASCMMAVKRGVAQWRGVAKSTAEIEAEQAVQREEEEAEAARLEAIKESQALSQAKKERLKLPSLLSTKAAEMKLSRRRTAAVSLLITQSLEQTFLHEVIKGLEVHGLDAGQAIDDALDMFGDRIGYSGTAFKFTADGFHLDDLEVRP